jgi:class 3 adenylate cyclase
MKNAKCTHSKKVVCMVAEDAFKEYDRILIQDIAKQLGMTLYGIRVKHAAEKSNAISREMLQSMIPPHVIEKISCFWDTSSDEYKRRRSSSSNGLASSFSEDENARTLLTSSRKRIRPENGVVEKVQILSKMYHEEVPEAEIGTLVTNESEVQQLSTTTKALYAENADDVCIIFADIVGFSRISLELEPLVVVNMLQDIFSRFDQLCDMHRIQKLETIGDAFIATAGIGKDVNDSINESAARILNMAKDMVHQARHVLIPTPLRHGVDSNLLNSLEIRVGIHVGNVTCGVLGQRLPKMTVFGETSIRVVFLTSNPVTINIFL